MIDADKLEIEFLHNNSWVCEEDQDLAVSILAEQDAIENHEVKFAKNEIAPCPFCGREPRLLHCFEGDFKIVCEGEDCEMAPETPFRDTAEEAINIWNKRAEDSTVVHAHWEEVSPYSKCGMKCSRCKAKISYRDYYSDKYGYCHNCGAKMDEEQIKE